jgi:hypothetical protein
LHREVTVEVPFEVVPDQESKDALAEIAAQKKADKAKEAAKAAETAEDAAAEAEAEAEAEVLDAMDAPAEAAE